MRIVSVLPSATEIVAALGHGAELVGRSQECDYPPEVTGVPVVMRARTWEPNVASRAIDDRVQSTRARGESLYELDVPLLTRLAPDLLLTQDLCGVCSVTPTEVADACARAGVHPSIVSLTPRTLDDVWDSVETVANAIGDAAAGASLAASLTGRARPPTGRDRPRVAIVEWLDPPILAGLWTPRMVRAAGGEPVGPGEGETGERSTWARVAELRPDLLVLSPCSFSVDRTVRELRDRALAAAVEGIQPPLGVLVADEAYFSRPGPRLADGVELLLHRIRQDAWEPPMPAQTWAAGRVAG
jgi:iron complex transport system substrate-binding protein